MNKFSIIAIIMSALMVMPTMATAKKHKGHGDGGHYGKSQKAGNYKRKKYQNHNKYKNRNKAWKRDGGKHHYRKNKSRKYKRFLNKSLRAFENKGWRRGHQGRRHYNKRRNHRPYDFDGTCLPQDLLRHRLIESGWHDFRHIANGGSRIRLLATNYNGRRFRLVIDACTGVIIKRRPLRRFWGADAY